MSIRPLFGFRSTPRFLLSVAKVTTATPSDPIQNAFVQKIKEYAGKSKTSEMGLANATQSELKELSDILAKVDRIFGASGQDMTQFPVFKFDQPQLVNPQSSITVEPPAITEESKSEEEKPKDDLFVLSI